MHGAGKQGHRVKPGETHSDSGPAFFFSLHCATVLQFRAGLGAENVLGSRLASRSVLTFTVLDY